MTYYHFVRVNKDGQAYLGYDDNRIITVGEPVTVEGEPILCEHGLHASARIIDALEYCPEGNVALCRVTLRGTVIHDTDKSVASERTIIAMLGAAQTAALLKDFVRWCALQVIDLWNAPDVVRQYLETGDETLRALAAMAAEAAWKRAWAARAAEASSAARAAAWAAAWAARAWAARAAASVARAAARVESKQAQEEKLVQLFEAAEGAAARAARRATNG